MTTTPTPQGEEPSIPDDVWERFVRDSESDIRKSAPKEPSARARMVTERLRLQDAEAARQQAKSKSKGRKAKKAESAAQPPGWRTGPDLHAADALVMRRRRRLGLLGVLLAAGLLAVALNPSRALSWLPGGSSGSSSSDSATLPRRPRSPAPPPPRRPSPTPRPWPSPSSVPRRRNTPTARPASSSRRPSRSAA